MDSVRFGRALGIGARGAAKALTSAADAAAAPNPNPVKSRSAEPQKTAAASAPAAAPQHSDPIASAARTAAHATVQARKTSKNIARGGKRFGEAVWGPFAKLSGVLWLEITGSFFGLFALFAGQSVWTHRTDLYSASAAHDARVHVIVFLAMALVFGYFCVSSFVRASRRQRRR